MLILQVLIVTKHRRYRLALEAAVFWQACFDVCNPPSDVIDIRQKLASELRSILGAQNGTFAEKNSHDRKERFENQAC